MPVPRNNWQRPRRLRDVAAVPLERGGEEVTIVGHESVQDIRCPSLSEGLITRPEGKPEADQE